MEKKSSKALPDNLEEEYYQISQDILQSFNKYHPPLDIYLLKEDVMRVLLHLKAKERLSKQQAEDLDNLTSQGLIFVSRVDHPVYVKHISYQLDLVLMDRHLTEAEIADIFQLALTRRMEEFFDQPIKVVADKLVSDLMVLTEYIWNDQTRVKALARRIHDKHSLANHSVNCLFVGLKIYLQMAPNDFMASARGRQTLDRVALGLALHDMGMSKIGSFLLDKTQALSPEDRQKINKHPQMGVEMLSKLDLKYPEVEQCVMQHHERINGSGYPLKLTGTDISALGLLTAAVDSFCAMIAERNYAKAIERKTAANSLSQDPRYDSDYTKQLATYLVETGQIKGAS